MNTTLVGTFGIVADNQLFPVQAKGFHELRSSEGGVAEYEAHAWPPSATSECEFPAAIRDRAPGEFTIDEFGVIHINMSAAEFLALKDFSHYPFRPYYFTGSLA